MKPDQVGGQKLLTLLPPVSDCRTRPRQGKATRDAGISKAFQAKVDKVLPTETRKTLIYRPKRNPASVRHVAGYNRSGRPKIRISTAQSLGKPRKP